MTLLDEIIKKASDAAVNMLCLHTVVLADEEFLRIEDDLRVKMNFLDRCDCPHCEYHSVLKKYPKKIVVNGPAGPIEIKKASSIRTEFIIGRMP